MLLLRTDTKEFSLDLGQSSSRERRLEMPNPEGEMSDAENEEVMEEIRRFRTSLKQGFAMDIDKAMQRSKAGRADRDARIRATVEEARSWRPPLTESKDYFGALQGDVENGFASLDSRSVRLNL